MTPTKFDVIPFGTLCRKSSLGNFILRGTTLRSLNSNSNLKLKLLSKKKRSIQMTKLKLKPRILNYVGKL